MSAIAYTQIDETYPVAGQDNNSQGFRDNFSYIKTALSVAQTEITSLENNTAKTNDDNDFNGQLIENAEYNKLYGSLAAQGSIPTSPGSGAATCDTSTGVYHTFTVTEPLTLTFSQWPASGKEARIRVDLKPDVSGAVTGLSGVISTTSTTTTITGILPNTAGLSAGMTLIKSSGTGAFGGIATIQSVDSSTQVTIVTTSANTTGNITFSANLRVVNFATSGGGAIKKDFSTPFALINTSTNSVFEVWTVNGGSTVYIKHIGNFS